MVVASGRTVAAPEWSRAVTGRGWHRISAVLCTRHIPVASMAAPQSIAVVVVTSWGAAHEHPRSARARGVSHRINEFAIRFLITIFTVIVWLALSVLLDISRDDTLISGTVVGAILLLLFVAEVISEISLRWNGSIRAVKHALRRRRKK
jgi:hypothetical protein